MAKRQANFKPLLITTTIRNPERLKDFLSVFYQYDGYILTDSIIDKVVKELIKKGLYRPTKINNAIKNSWEFGIDLSDAEVEQVFGDNPQNHKEAGFARGWPSRFDTWFKIAKELGFVYYWAAEKIVFSESGIMLLDRDKPENEQLVFANAFAKYQRNNPFRNVSNNNVPLILLIETIRLLNADNSSNATGISRQELPLLLCWQDNNADKLYRTIKGIREKYGYTPSDDIILDACYDLLDATKRDEKSILVDYPDDLMRKMRLTGLFSIRGGGRFIDLNSKEINAIDYIVKKYANYKAYTSERAFFNYMGKVDIDLITKLSNYQAPIKTLKTDLNKWANHYTWETIKAEMEKLSRKKGSNDPILRIIEEPLRLEFLTALAILKKLPHVAVNPNFVSDDEGLPISFAAGGKPDITCNESQIIILVEVTLLTGTQQHIRESYSIQRHLEEFINKGNKAFSLFLSPKAFIDTCRNANFIKFQYQLDVRILDIELFLQQLETQKTLYDVAYTANSC